jgi:thiamine-monophosphate kinase
VDIIGGDTTHSSVMVISVTLLGEVKPDLLTRRSGAKPGDIIKVTGDLGGATAGLRLFLKKIDGFDAVKSKHTEPECRLDVSDSIATVATAMEDVSDGLASEVRNICQMSGTGAVIFKNKIPIAPSTFEAASASGEDAYDYALYGGEDFELVYTVPKEEIDSAPGTVVGEIIEEKNIYLEEQSVLKKLEKFGFDHFG